MGIDPISIGIMAAGTLLQTGGAIMGAGAQAKENKARQSQADLEAQNQTLQQVRQARIKRAQIIQSGANAGVGGSSSVVGGAFDVQTTANQNVGYIGTQQSINSNILKAQQEQTNAAGLSNLGAGITNVGGTVFGHDQFISKKTGIPVGDIFG